MWGYFHIYPGLLDHPKLPDYLLLLRMFGGQVEKIQEFLDSLVRGLETSSMDSSMNSRTE
jgi:hypothetical protein